MRFWNCEFCQNWHFQIVNFWINWGVLPQCVWLFFYWIFGILKKYSDPKSKNWIFGVKIQMLPFCFKLINLGTAKKKWMEKANGAHEKFLSKLTLPQKKIRGPHEPLGVERCNQPILWNVLQRRGNNTII